MRTGGGAVLDDAAALARIDASDMLGQVATVPAQLADAWDRSRGLVLPSGRPGAVALLGMGGSAIGGDLARAIWSDRLGVPLEVVRGYDLPAWVGADALVVASSYSGATEETISALGAALERRCPVAIVTTGGPLRDVAERAGLPLLTFPGGGQPRAAVGYSLGLLGGLLERAGVLDLEGEEVEAAARAAAAMASRCAPDIATDRNPAKQLAWWLVDRLPIIEASGFLGPVARRWKTQLNENGKTSAAWEELPEATHNAVVGYAQPESLRDRLYVVFLASPLDHPRNTLRSALSAELLSAVGIGHQVVPIPGEGRLAQAISAIVLGDMVSAYLAVVYGLDPTPVDAIGHIKRRLSATDEDEPG
jgi:glucose/mannose-6-phosphate isomerase